MPALNVFFSDLREVASCQNLSFFPSVAALPWITGQLGQDQTVQSAIRGPRMEVLGKSPSAPPVGRTGCFLKSLQSACAFSSFLSGQEEGVTNAAGGALAFLGWSLKEKPKSALCTESSGPAQRALPPGPVHRLPAPVRAS